MTAYYELVEDRHVAPALLEARARAQKIALSEMGLHPSSYLASFVRAGVQTPKSELCVIGPAHAVGFADWRSSLSMPVAFAVVDRTVDETFRTWLHEFRHVHQRLTNGAKAWDDRVAIEVDAEAFVTSKARYGGCHA